MLLVIAILTKKEFCVEQISSLLSRQNKFMFTFSKCPIGLVAYRQYVADPDNRPSLACNFCEGPEFQTLAPLQDQRLWTVDSRLYTVVSFESGSDNVSRCRVSNGFLACVV